MANTKTLHGILAGLGYLLMKLLLAALMIYFANNRNVSMVLCKVAGTLFSVCISCVAVSLQFLLICEV